MDRIDETSRMNGYTTGFKDSPTLGDGILWTSFNMLQNLIAYYKIKLIILIR